MYHRQVRPILHVCCVLGTGLLAGAGQGCQPPPLAPPGRCLEAPRSTGSVLARVGQVAITDARLERRVRAQGSGRHPYENAKGLRELLDDEMRFELLAQAALDRGLAQDPEVVDTARRLLARRLLQRDLGAALFENKLGEEALRAYYERNRTNYLQPEKRRFAHIQLEPTQEGRAVAQSLIDKLQNHTADSDFGGLVQRYSQDAATKQRGGDQAFHTRDELVPLYGVNFANSIFAREPSGLLPQPVQSIEGWHVVRVVARREALARDFAEVRDQIRERLVQSERSEEFQHYLDEIRETYPVVVYDDRLQALLRTWTGKGT